MPAKSSKEDLARLGAALAAGGAGIGATAAVGPAGGLVVPVVKRGLDEVLTRLLSDRQKNRVETAAGAASAYLQEELADGKRVRDDGFFEARDGRWSANEVTEAVLIAAANEPMEMKVPYQGHLLAMVAVERLIDVQTSHWLIKQAEDLTWTQYLQLAIVGRLDELSVPDIAMDAEQGSGWSAKNARLQMEDLGYAKRELIGGRRRAGDTGRLAVINTHLPDQELRGNGPLIYWALGLYNVPAPVLQEHISLLAQVRAEPDEEA